MGNVVLTVPRRYTEYFLRPFVSGGFGLLRAAPDRPSGAADGSRCFPARARTSPASIIGGGAVGFFSQSTGVRFDLRYFSTRARHGATMPA